MSDKTSQSHGPVPPDGVESDESDTLPQKTPSDLIIDGLLDKDWKNTEKILRENVPIILTSVRLRG